MKMPAVKANTQRLRDAILPVGVIQRVKGHAGFTGNILINVNH